ncbi:MAG TPA: penicillin acylase family protein, partial [Candidatus Limnocylindrales bacterium]|nr:penicillin acylase family protein [Candidatus Limnocylindrales bacterium]
MTRIFGVVRRLAWLVIAIAIVLVAAGSGLLAVLTMRGLPTTNGTLAIDGLERGARVTRDASGIAMISAETSHDLFLAQGYVHAQDRMWQMEVWRHISAGRLSELFG